MIFRKLYASEVVSWSFLTNHARVLLCIAHDPGVRLRDIAASLDITERNAFDILTDLAEAGYVVKEKNGRRNRYHIQAHLPLPEPTARERSLPPLCLPGSSRSRIRRQRTKGRPRPGPGPAIAGRHRP